jgi:hypothetical protein
MVVWGRWDTPESPGVRSVVNKGSLLGTTRHKRGSLEVNDYFL